MSGGATTPLEVRDLSCTLSGRKVLDDVNLSVDAGELVGLIGPNGAGKTTLLRGILGLIPIDEGEVRVSGVSGRAARRRIGYVPQRHDFAWDFPISAREAVLTGRAHTMGLRLRASLEDHRAVEEALRRVRLDKLADRPIGEFSGGQRQRILVARALAARPDVLLLDEPFTGVDMPSLELLLDLCGELTAQGTAIVMSTHDLGEAVEFSDRLIMLNRTVAATGRPKDLKDKELWMRTFRVSERSPLLKTVGVA